MPRHPRGDFLSKIVGTSGRYSSCHMILSGRGHKVLTLRPIHQYNRHTMKPFTLITLRLRSGRE